MKLIISIFLLFITSCSIQGSFQGLFSYYNKVRKTDLKMMRYSENESFLSSDQFKGVILMNGKELKDCLSKYSKVLVHLWKPNCQGKHCYSLSLLQKFCTENEYEFYVVAEYYDYKKI